MSQLTRELLENQMQEQININPRHALRLRGTAVAALLRTPFAKEIHKLVVVKLRLQQTVERHLCECARNHHAALRALDLEHANGVGGDGHVEAVPLALVVSGPGDEDALFGEVARAVLEGAESVFAARPLELAHVVVLAGEGEEELFLAPLVLECHHGLLNVIVVRLELRFEEMGFVVERGKGRAHAFKFLGTLDAASVLSSNIDSDGVEQVLVVVVRSYSTSLLEGEDVFERMAFERVVIKIKDCRGRHVGSVGRGGR